MSCIVWLISCGIVLIVWLKGWRRCFDTVVDELRHCFDSVVDRLRHCFDGVTDALRHCFDSLVDGWMHYEGGGESVDKVIEKHETSMQILFKNTGKSVKIDVWRGRKSKKIDVWRRLGVSWRVLGRLGVLWRDFGRFFWRH